MTKRCYLSPKIALTIGATLVLSSLAACGVGASGAGPKAGDALVIGGEQIAPAKLMDAARKEGALSAYFIYPEDDWSKVLDQFTKDTGINVTKTRAPTGVLYSRVVAEAASGNLGADIIDFGDPSLTVELASKKTIQPFTAPNADQIPQAIRDPQHYSQVVALNPTVIGYNSAEVKAADAPTSFKDLLNPKWKGRVGLTSIETGGGPIAREALIRLKYGVDYWKSMVAQAPKLYPSIVPLTQEIARGQILVGVTDFGPVTNTAAAGSPIKAVFPKDGVPAYPIASMISATTKRFDAALVYEAWAASKHGGSIIAKGFGGYSSNPASELPEMLPASERANLVLPSHDQWLNDRKAWIAEWNTIFNR